RLHQEFDAVQAKAVGFITRWHNLPHTVSSTLLKLVEEKADLGPVGDVAAALSGITSERLASLLNTQLSRVDFFHTPAGRLLESIADKGVLNLPAVPLDDLHAIGAKVFGILDGSTVEETLTRFQRFVATELHLDAIFR